MLLLTSFFRIYLLFTIFFNGCKKPDHNTDQPFTRSASYAVQPGLIDEVSGIADSYSNDGMLWAEQDGGNAADVHLIRQDGSYVKPIHVNGAINRDWEDIALGAGPANSLKYLYIADIGDNNAQYSSYSIYRFPEPSKTIDTIFSYDKIQFEYPDGAHDAEALLIDNNTRDLYIITKRESASIIYKVPYPQSATTVNKAVKLFALSFSGAVSAAISQDQKELVMKTYTRIYYWKLGNNEGIESALKRSPVELNYELEPQGEAICFKKDGSGFFTLSEKGLASAVNLNFYKRN